MLRGKFGFQIWAYVIMAGHVLVLVNPGVTATEMSVLNELVRG